MCQLERYRYKLIAIIFVLCLGLVQAQDIVVTQNLTAAPATVPVNELLCLPHGVFTFQEGYPTLDGSVSCTTYDWALINMTLRQNMGNGCYPVQVSSYPKASEVRSSARVSPGNYAATMNFTVFRKCVPDTGTWFTISYSRANDQGIEEIIHVNTIHISVSPPLPVSYSGNVTLGQNMNLSLTGSAQIRLDPNCNGSVGAGGSIDMSQPSIQNSSVSIGFNCNYP